MSGRNENNSRSVRGGEEECEKGVKWKKQYLLLDRHYLVPIRFPYQLSLHASIKFQAYSTVIIIYTGISLTSIHYPYGISTRVTYTDASYFLYSLPDEY